MIDVYYAIEGNNSCVQLRDLANHVFSSSNAAQTVNDNMSELFNESEQSFFKSISKLSFG
ncbi:hypothetical protein TMU3MR103_0294 [Tetragenococcus muriaticus 3MR10-3]|uniref:Uncharacterized protein n=2 Tax=Tetragenococcus muriaticus TaxID=64642 RepID=A0A091C973_9ENTE|nr:hypothetical protein TMU3MR103_0294 [Tetragenococcus muriaticus 3MR10-3]